MYIIALLIWLLFGFLVFRLDRISREIKALKPRKYVRKNNSILKGSPFDIPEDKDFKLTGE